VRTKLYVTNFPEDMDQEEMKQLFNNYGNVLECTIMWNQYAFVHFGSYGEAEKALNAIKGVQYKGYKISVQWSTSAKYQQPKQQAALPNTNGQHSKLTLVPPPQPTKILERPSFAAAEKPVNAWSMKKPAEENVGETSPSAGGQSWASIMNSASPILDSADPGPLKSLAEKTNSTPGQFKISFSEMVRSSNASASVRGQLSSNSGSSLCTSDGQAKAAALTKKQEQDKENAAVGVVIAKKIEVKAQKQAELSGHRYLQESGNQKGDLEPLEVSSASDTGKYISYEVASSSCFRY